MCLNRQCQNVSVFGVHECSAKCSGRGVSTSFNLFVQTVCVRAQSLPDTVSGTQFRFINMNKSHFGVHLVVAVWRGQICGLWPSLWWGDPNCSSTSHRQILYTTDVFVAIATVVSSGLWWLQNSYGKRYDICDTPEIKASMLCRGEASWTLQSNILHRILTVLEPL